MKEDINQQVKEIMAKTVQESFARTQEQMPLFTDILLLWANKNNYTDALTAFLACFVDAAVVNAIGYITTSMNRAASEKKRELRKAKREAGNE